MGITITNVKIVGICSKCRKDGDEIKRDKNGRKYRDDEISCVSCALGKTKTTEEQKAKEHFYNKFPSGFIVGGNYEGYMDSFVSGYLQAKEDFKEIIKKAIKETGALQNNDDDAWGEGYDNGVEDLSEILQRKMEMLK